MKNNCFHRCFISSLFFIGWFLNLKAQESKSLIIDSDFQKANIKAFSKIIGEDSKTNKDFFYFSFKDEFNTVKFTIENSTASSKNLILELSNALIKEAVLSKLINGGVVQLYKTGIDYEISSKPIEHRLFAFPILLKPLETATFQLELKKESGKPLVTSALIKTEAVFNKESSAHLMFIGMYYGISLLSIFFSVFIFYILRNYSYLVYALYIVFLGLFITSYTGLFSQFFLDASDVLNKYKHYVILSEISLLLFVVFSQNILEAKIYMPKLKKAINVLLIVLVSIRILIHFFFTELFEHYVPIFMNLWYIVFLTMIVLITIEIILYFKTNFKRSSLFALAYMFMISGVGLTILYHSYGLINTTFLGLPLVFYSSFLEILFLTSTVVLMVKNIYDERNALSEKLVLEERKNLTAFIKGEDQERKRISRELHDNIGSQLSYLKRFVSGKFNNNAVNEVIDAICSDVRNLSHEISPSDLKLIGFKNAISDLARDLSSQTSLSVDFNSYKFPEKLQDNTEIQLYRVVQEALNNVLKHAAASCADIQLIGHGSFATMAIEDDGKGFDLNIQKEGIGLKNIILRVNQIGGKLELDSKPNKGTSLLITFPL